jgi:hypothetical protein
MGDGIHIPFSDQKLDGFRGDLAAISPGHRSKQLSTRLSCKKMEEIGLNSGNLT